MKTKRAKKKVIKAVQDDEIIHRIKAGQKRYPRCKRTIVEETIDKMRDLGYKVIREVDQSNPDYVIITAIKEVA